MSSAGQVSDINPKNYQFPSHSCNFVPQTGSPKHDGFLTTRSDHLGFKEVQERGRSGDTSGVCALKRGLKAIRRALRMLGKMIESLARKAKALSARPTSGSITASGSSYSDLIGGPAGFLWKPVSDSNGKLVVLLPSSFNGIVAAVNILSPDGKAVLAAGSYAGIANGSRAHFRFDREGGAFPPGVYVQIVLRDGTQRLVKILNPAARIEGR